MGTVLLAVLSVPLVSADESEIPQHEPVPGVFHGTMYYGLKGNVSAQINLRWTTDRQLVGELIQGEHQQRLTNKPLGFVGSIQQLRGYAKKFSSCDVGIGDVLVPSRSDVIETWPSGAGKMRMSYNRGKLSPSVIDGTRGSFVGQSPLDIPKPEKQMRTVLPSDWEAEQSLHGNWVVADAGEGTLPSQIYRFGPSQLEIISDGKVSSVMSYISRPDLSSRALDMIRFADGGISVSRMYYRIEDGTLRIAFGPANSPRPRSLEDGLGFTVVEMHRSEKDVPVERRAMTPSEQLLSGLRHDGSRLDKSQQRTILKRMLASKDAIDQGYLAVVCAAGHFGVTKRASEGKITSQFTFGRDQESSIRRRCCR